jgi:hypothetical protein
MQCKPSFAAVRCARVLPALVLVSLLSAEPLKASPCLGLKASDKVKLVTVPPGTELTYGTSTSTAGEGDEPFTACLDAERVIGLGYGLAVELRAKAPLPPANQGWKALRAHLKDDTMQTGCLKKLPAGTALYDRPDGEVVGVVVEPAFYGRWDVSKTPSGQWSMLKAGVGNVPLKLWLKDGGKDWCPP